MPIYEYECRKCGEVVEKIQKFSDPPLRKHAGCGGSLTKLISQSSFQLKGSGWYATDYAGKTKADGGAADKAPSGDAKETKSGSGESESAEKSEKSGKAGDAGKKPPKEKAPSGATN